MNIWIINHYAVPTKYYPLARPANFAKYLIRMGHHVTIFAASTVHNSDINLIDNHSLFKTEKIDDIQYVYIRANDYKGNGINRIINMFLFPFRLPKVCKNFEKPDAIIAVSATPMACMCGLKLAKKFGCKGIAEVADLWPESFVSYGLIKKKNPLLKIMYEYEKRMYMKADAIVFTMEGGKDYIIDKKWDIENGGSIDLKKIYYINNGIDFEEFECNKKKYIFSDVDLENKNIIKIIYTGSIRKANASIMILPEVAKKLRDRGIKNLKILVYGKGDYTEKLRHICEEKNINNLVVKGYVDKKYIPYILSKGNINILNCNSSDVMRYGGSQNKLFEYLASGHPIISGEASKYSIINNNDCGISRHFNNADEIVDEIINLINNPIDSEHIRSIGKEYDFKILTNRLLDIMQSI